MVIILISRGIKLTKFYKGCRFIILSGIIYGAMPLAAKLVYAGGSNPISLVLYRNLLCIPILFFIIRVNNSIDLQLTKDECKNIFKLATLGGIITPILLYSSYNYITSGVATTIHFIYPVIVFIIGVVYYKETINLIRVGCVILCFIGIMMFYIPFSSNNFLGLILSFLSGLTYAIYITFLDKSGLKKMNPIKLTFFICTCNSIILIMFTWITKTLIITISPLGWVVALLLSIVINFVAIIPFQIGVSLIGPQRASILSTFEPITSIIIAFLVLNESLSFTSIFGTIIVLFSVVVLIVFDGAKSEFID